MAPDGSRWLPMAPDGSRWLPMAANGFHRVSLLPNHYPKVLAWQKEQTKAKAAAAGSAVKELAGSCGDNAKVSA